jgi:hypothetical protein
MGTARRKPGLLGPHVEGYRSWLARRGYTPDTVRNMLKDLGQVGLWLQAERLEVSDLNEQQLARFLADRLAAGKRPRVGLRAIVPLLTYLAGNGRNVTGHAVHGTAGRSAWAVPGMDVQRAWAV